MEKIEKKTDNTKISFKMCHANSLYLLRLSQKGQNMQPPNQPYQTFF